MQLFLEILAGLVAYIIGLVLIVRVTPRLLFRSYDEVRFMVFAMLAILGAFLVFGGIIIPLFASNGNSGIRFLDFILFLVVVFITGRIALFCFRDNTQGVQLVSRYGAGSFCLFLALASLYCIVALFR